MFSLQAPLVPPSLKSQLRLPLLLFQGEPTMSVIWIDDVVSAPGAFSFSVLRITKELQHGLADCHQFQWLHHWCLRDCIVHARALGLDQYQSCSAISIAHFSRSKQALLNIDPNLQDSNFSDFSLVCVCMFMLGINLCCTLLYIDCIMSQ